MALRVDLLELPQIEPLEVGLALGGLGVLVALFAWMAVTLTRMVRRLGFGKEKERIAEAWKDVEDLMQRGDDMSARLAVMHADAVLDKAFQAKYFPGTKFAERMAFAQRRYSSLRKVWWAHKLRNELAHNPHYELRGKEAGKAVAAFRQALRDLGAL